MTKYPILMKPYLKHTLWAGTKLINEFGKDQNGILAESWELSDYNGSESVAENGEYKGMTYTELHSLFSPDTPSVLIKFIDSAKDLSVQIHPSVECGNAKPKNECWYVISADEGAKIAYGLKREVLPDELREASLTGSLTELLNYIEVKSGDFFYVPAGLIHAIGAGITVVEIQQTSDTTYRLFDYGRLDANGKERELHVDDGVKAYRHFTCHEINLLRFSNEGDDLFGECLARSPYFAVYRSCGDEKIKIQTEKESAIIFLSEGCIYCDGNEYKAKKGDTYYIPPMTEAISASNDMIITSF